MGAGPFSHTSEDESRKSQSIEQPPYEAAVWKDQYVRLFADLENTKKRLAHSAAQEVQSEKEALLRDMLPVAEGLDMALIHISRGVDNRSILEGVDLVRDILNKFIIKPEVKAINVSKNPLQKQAMPLVAAVLISITVFPVPAG